MSNALSVIPFFLAPQLDHSSLYSGTGTLQRTGWVGRVLGCDHTRDAESEQMVDMHDVL